MHFIAIIPARYASTRFPGKPLAKLGGKTVIERVYQQVSKAVDDLCVATDDDRIRQAVEVFGGRVVMTSPNHRSGTDRIREALDKLNENENGNENVNGFREAPEQTAKNGDDLVIINVQGDEPFIQPSQISTVMRCFDDPDTQIATLGKRFESVEAMKNPNSPKIVTDNRGFALYFSRSPIPFVRGKDEAEWLSHYPFLKHIGLYAYRARVLREVTQLPPSPLEVAESLEQLRWLENGYRIKVAETDAETIGIDTPDDLQRAEEWLRAKIHG